ncbi:hypothetical protein BCAH1134_C0442 (plasmid) [Bacillus cereus AH1134]|nr:hypothetical protein BCAH1134_C0442 [Bacillus cereus AH1134]
MIISKEAAARPLEVNIPLSTKSLAQLAHSQGHELIYCIDAIASTGITETMAIQLAHAAINPTKSPCEYCVYFTIPPASGIMAPNSLYGKAINNITIIPKTQEKIAAPPDILAAFHAPNNQPDPKIEPIPVIVSAKVPSLRFIFFIFHTLLVHKINRILLFINLFLIYTPHLFI